MKKYVLLAIIILISCIITSCGGDDSKENPESEGGSLTASLTSTCARCNGVGSHICETCNGEGGHYE